MKNIDYSIYYVTDENLLSDNHSLETSVEEAILGGAGIIQLREKNSSTLDFYNKAIKIKSICDKYNVALIINDRIDIALAIDSDGVHLGQKDMPLEIARKILGKDKIIGISASNIQEALFAQKNGANYLGVGAIYQTDTKTNANLTSVDTLKCIKKSVDIPVVAIGGIKLDNINSLYQADVDGIAVVSAISLSTDTINTTRTLKNKFNRQYKTKAVIFDIDGTLVETMDIWDKVLINLMKTYNISYTKQELEMIWNMGFYDIAKYSIEKFSLKISEKDFMTTIRDLSVEEYKKSDIKLKKGIKKVLNYIKSKGIKLAIATALSKKQYEIVLEKTGINNYFDIIASSADLKTEKNERKIYDYISNELNIDSKNMVFFEDDINSAIGAKTAQVKFCNVFNKKYENNTKYNHLIDYTIRDFEDDIIYDEIIVL